MNHPGPYNQPQQPPQGYNQQPSAEQQPGGQIPMIGAAAMGNEVQPPAYTDPGNFVGTGPNGESLYRGPDGTIASVAPAAPQQLAPGAPAASNQYPQQGYNQPPTPPQNNRVRSGAASADQFLTEALTPEGGPQYIPTTPNTPQTQNFGPQGTPEATRPYQQQDGVTKARGAHETQTTQVSGSEIDGLIGPPPMTSKPGENWQRTRPTGRKPRWQQPIIEE